MGLSLGHLLILGVVILLFGTRRLPELASALGKTAKAFRDAVNGPDQKSELKLEESNEQVKGDLSSKWKNKT